MFDQGFFANGWQAVAERHGLQVEALAQDSMKVVNQTRKRAWAERIKNPLGDGRPLPAATMAKLGLNRRTGALGKVRRRL